MTRRDKVLAQLKMHGQINSAMVSAAQGISTSNASAVLNKMESEGYIRRVGDSSTGRTFNTFVAVERSNPLAFGVEDSAINRYLMGAM